MRRLTWVIGATLRGTSTRRATGLGGFTRGDFHSPLRASSAISESGRSLARNENANLHPLLFILAMSVENSKFGGNDGAVF